jgi:hypothetical protein
MIKWEKLFNGLFVRFLLSGFGFRSPYHQKKWEITPYFQYKIGPYQADYYLYFRRPPFWQRYKNEIFDKMSEYGGYDLTHYLDFHYSAFEDKKEFLRFIRYEISERTKWLTSPKPTSYRLCLEMTLEWAREKDAALTAATSSQAPVIPVPATMTPTSTDSLVSEETLSVAESKMNELTQSFAGKITLNNHYHQVRLIQLLILLKDLQAPGRKVQPLFKSFSSTDLAAILRQFEEFRDKKTNTLQKKIIESNNELHPGDPKVQSLTKALTDFFY